MLHSFTLRQQLQTARQGLLPLPLVAEGTFLTTVCSFISRIMQNVMGGFLLNLGNR